MSNINNPNFIKNRSANGQYKSTNNFNTNFKDSLITGYMVMSFILIIMMTSSYKQFITKEFIINSIMYYTEFSIIIYILLLRIITITQPFISTISISNTFYLLNMILLYRNYE